MNIRIMEIARRFAREHEVTFALTTRWKDDEAFCDAIRRQGFGVIARPGNVGRAAYLESALELLRGRPPINAWRGSRALEKELMLRIGSYDVIQLEYEMFGNLPYLFAKVKRPIVSIVLHDLMSEAFARIAQIEPTLLLRWLRLINVPGFKRIERRLLRRFDLSIVMSKREHDLIARHVPEPKILMVPNCADSSAPPLKEAGNSAPVILFIGQMDYPPNIDAARWLITEIFPRVRTEYASARLLLVGGASEPAKLGLKGEGVEYVGGVDDVTPFYRQADVVAAPLRAGGGTRLKILEAMARGRPVVSTTLGAEGLDAIDGRHLVIADTPDEIAAGILSLFRDGDRRASICAEARSMVVARFNWDNAVQVLIDRYVELHRRRLKADQA
nr:hypothetical protein Hi04_10k_c5981_00010 [uncultured bacterium]